MADKSAIEWTDATWNPVRAVRTLPDGKGFRTGWFCTHVSEGCRFCYAETWNERLGTGLAYKPGHRDDVEIYLDEKMLQAPLKWTKPRRIFTLSMSDLFADFVTDEWLDRIFAVMATAKQHSFQVLTKRPERMLSYCKTLGRHGLSDRVARAAMTLSADKGFGFAYKLGAAGWHLDNVWLGVSVEDQAAADERIPDLLATPAAKRFLSCEPLLGPIDIERYVADRTADPRSELTDEQVEDGWSYDRQARIDWVIAGGESGAGARPMHPAWARSLRDQCAAAGAPFFFKQWGEWAIGGGRAHFKELIAEPMTRVDSGIDGVRPQFMVRDGKRKAGRLLDGVVHDGFPDMRRSWFDGKIDEHSL